MINSGGGSKAVTHNQGEIPHMKKIMSLMLGLSLIVGAASVAFAQEKGGTDTEKGKGKGKGKGKKGGDTDKKDKR